MQIKRKNNLKFPLPFLLLAGVLLLAACNSTVSAASEQTVANGDPNQGRVALAQYGCGSCHMVPGVTGADGLVGPPLAGFARRTYIAGRLPNRPDNLVYWIRHPQTVEPGTAMPDLGVTESDAQDIAAYLYTLQDLSGLR